MNNKRPRVDTAWFMDRIRASTHRSLRQLAPKIVGRQGPLEPSALSLMLRGRREIRLEEARQLATLLDTPLVEVLRRAGVDIQAGAGQGQVPVVGRLGADGVVELGQRFDSVLAPPETPAGAIAVVVEGDPLMEGWLLYAEKPAPPGPDIIGRPCLYKPTDAPAQAGFIRRGYRAGTYSVLRGLHTPLRQGEAVILDWVAPILWFRPPH